MPEMAADQLLVKEEVRARIATSYEVPLVNPSITAIRFPSFQTSATSVQAVSSLLSVTFELM